MELALLGGLIYSGYYLNKTTTRQPILTQRNTVIPNDTPSGKNIYSSNMANEANFAVLNKSTQNYIYAEDPKVTGILPPIFNTYGVNGNNNVSGTGEFKPSANYPLNTLSGSDMNKINELNRRVNVIDSQDVPIVNRPMFNNNFGNGISTDTNSSNDGVPFNKDKVVDLINPLTGIPYENEHKNK